MKKDSFHLSHHKSVLVVAAHPDDEVLGCGGTMARLSDAGCSVHILVMGEGITSRQDSRSPELVKKEIEKLHSEVKRASKCVGAASSEVLNFPDNRFDTVPLLDLIKAVSKKKEEVKPSLILTHYGNDLNIDHRVLFQAVITSCRPMAGEVVREILSFEVPSSTEWQANGTSFMPDMYVGLKESHLDAKIKGMETYSSEKRAFPHPRSPEAIRALSVWRGSNCGEAFAESFKVIRRLV